MMDCTEYRRAMLADPHDPDPLLREHRESCHACTQYTDQLLRFELRLDRALRVTVPASGLAPVRANGASTALRAKGAPPLLRAPGYRPGYRKGWLAMAASVLLAVAVAGGLWLAAPNPSLAADVVTHMAGEPDAWRRTDVPVSATALQDVLRDSKLRLAPAAGMVSYAASCAFRGRTVPHLVVQTESGPVTVMVLVHETVSKSVPFDEQGYRGLIVPVAGHGSIAVLTRGEAVDPSTVKEIAARVQGSLVWTG
jgi:hypothetical protein